MVMTIMMMMMIIKIIIIIIIITIIKSLVYTRKSTRHFHSFCNAGLIMNVHSTEGSVIGGYAATMSSALQRVVPQ
jgi:hypothetical protein